MRIEETVHNQVETALGGTKERTRVVDDRAHARVVVRSFWVIGLPGQENGGIDLYGINVSGARAQSGRDIITAAGADDGHRVCAWPGAIRKIIVLTSGEQFGIGGSPDSGVRQVMHALVVMTGGADYHESVRTVADVQRLVRGIDLVPQGVHGPDESRQSDHDQAHS